MGNIQEIPRPTVNKKEATSSFRSFAIIGNSSITLGYFLRIVVLPCLLLLPARQKPVSTRQKPVLRRRMRCECRNVAESARFYQMVSETHNLLPTDYLLQVAVVGWWCRMVERGCLCESRWTTIVGARGGEEKQQRGREEDKTLDSKMVMTLSSWIGGGHANGGRSCGFETTEFNS